MMPNGDVINDRLEFQERIKAMPVEERTTETALMIYDLITKVETLAVGGTSKKASAMSGGITGGIIAAGIALAEYFRPR